MGDKNNSHCQNGQKKNFYKHPNLQIQSFLLETQFFGPFSYFLLFILLLLTSTGGNLNSINQMFTINPRFKNVYTVLLITGLLIYFEFNLFQKKQKGLEILSRKTTRGRALSFLNILLSQVMLYFFTISAEVFLCNTSFFVTFVMHCRGCVWKYKLSWK